MRKDLRAIVVALKSQSLADILIGYVFAHARKTTSDRNAVVAYIQSRLIKVAENQDYDAISGAAAALLREFPESSPQSIGTGVATALMLLFPFARKVSLTLAGDFAEWAHGRFPGSVVEPRSLEAAKSLWELFETAWSRGNMELSEDIAERAYWRLPDGSPEKAAAASALTEIATANRKRLSALLGATRRLNTLAKVGAQVRNEPDGFPK